MPAGALHITFIGLLADAGIPPELSRAIRNQPRHARLGAMLYDVPFYSNMALMAIRYGLNRPAESRYWAELIHDGGGAVTLFAHLVERLRHATDLSEDCRLALLAGVGSHLALDVAQHDLVRFIARREAASGPGDESFHHRFAEKFQSLYFHIDTFGRDILGTREWFDRTHLSPGASLLWRRHEPAVTRVWREALRDTYGSAPTVEQWTSWLRAFVHFGLITSGYLTRRNTRLYGNAENRRIYYSNDLFHFPDHMETAARLAERTLILAYDYYRGNRLDADTRQQLIADLGLPGNIAFPRVTAAPHPLQVPPLPARLRPARALLGA